MYSFSSTRRLRKYHFLTVTLDVHRPSDVVKSSLQSIISDKNRTMVSLHQDEGADRQSNATVDIPADVKDALKKFRFKKSTSNSAISGMSPIYVYE